MDYVVWYFVFYLVKFVRSFCLVVVCEENMCGWDKWFDGFLGVFCGGFVV